MLRVSKILRSLGLVGLAAAANVALTAASQAAVATYDIYDHFDGTQTSNGPPPIDYGLRLDHIAGKNDPASFWSFEDASGSGVSLARMVVNFSTGIGRIIGEMRRNSDDSLWTVDVTMTGIDDSPANGWRADSFTGSLTPSMGAAINLIGKDDSNGWSFTYATSAGSGLDYRGGIPTAAGWVDYGGTNDFLFTVSSVPLPPALALGLLGVAGFGLYRRKQRASA